MSFEAPTKREPAGPQADEPMAGGLTEALTGPGAQYTSSGPLPPVAGEPPADHMQGLSASERAFGPAAPPAATSPHKTVRLGSRGRDVIDLQRALDSRGESLDIDGVFGPNTRAAVVRFQQANGLDADGIVGPRTWAALDGGASDGGDAVQGEALAVGDAEGNGEEVIGTTSDGLQTLGPGGSTGVASGNALGFGPAKGPPRPPPVKDAAKPTLLAGGFADLGAYNSTGTGFVEPQLDHLLELYGTFWNVDVRAAPRPDDTALKPSGGDSAGKGVSSQPPWVKALQNKIIGRPKWDDDDRATQKLIESFLRGWTRANASSVAPGAEQLVHQIGASETNGQADSLTGFRGASDWCAGASNRALILGLYNRGLRFKDDTHSHQYQQELTKQTAKFVKWANKPSHQVTGTAAHTAALSPGDIISVVNGGPSGPLSGHVATVVNDDGSKIVYVSGNAGGVVAFEGAVRIEEVTRDVPPAGYDWLAIATRSNDYARVKAKDDKESGAIAKTKAQMAAKVQAILERNAGKLSVPSVDLNDPVSVAAFVAFALASGDDESIAHALELQRLQAELTPQLAPAAKDHATRVAMEKDGGTPVNREDKRFVPGVHAPKDPQTSWVVNVVKASGLAQAQVLASGATDTVPADSAIERGPKLSEQCPDAPSDVVNGG